MELIVFLIIICCGILYLNYLLFSKFIKHEKMIEEANIKIINVTNLLLNINKRTIELTDIELQELEENLIKKIKIA